MDALRTMRRCGLPAAVLTLALPAVAAAAPSTIGYDGTSHDITYSDPSGNTDRVAVEIDTDPSGGGQDAFGFHVVAGGLQFDQTSGCTTISGGIVVCPFDGLRFVFALAGGDDTVDLSSPELTTSRRRPSAVEGGSGNDRLVGGALGDDFNAGPGDDHMVGLTDLDRFRGGDGRDTLELAAGGPWTVSLDGVANDGAGAAPTGDVEPDVEVIVGGPGGDSLTGAAGAQTINGGGGADVIDGGAGADGINGAAGNDTIAARDRSVDTIACGDGADTVTADWNDSVGLDCESVSRSVRDDDGDGAAHGADCNDANPAIRPGRGDIAGNGIDEDCDGRDAVVDGDGDGANAGADCDDANPAIRPGAVDVPGNKVDEDCSGADARRSQVAGTFSSGWRVFARWTVITKLGLKGAPRGAKLQVRCAGRGCPVKRKRVKLRAGRANLTKLFKRARLRPGTVVQLRLTAPGTIGKVVRLTMRRGKAPKSIALCLPPGASKPRRC